MKNKNDKYIDCISTNVTSVTWNLPPVSCLGIKTGDSMDLVTFAIVQKICASFGDTNLDDIELSCIVDLFDVNEPTERSVATLLQLAFDNECTLFNLIQDVRELITNDVPLSLDLKCLATYDAFGNQIAYNEKTVFQFLINQVCILVGQISGLTISISNLQAQINALPAPYTEPNLNTCIAGTPKTTSQTVQLIASDYCAYKIKVGTIGAIDQAIGAQPVVIDITDPLFANVDLVTPVTSMANSETNQWVFIESMLQRLKGLEACACVAKCSDIKIGFNVVDQVDGASLVLDFSGDYGNYIPSDYALQTDSTITFIDANKKQKSYPLPTTPGVFKTEYESVPFDISMLDLNGMMVIKVCVKLKNTKTNEICCKCEEVQHMFVGACSYCEIKALSEVTIIFSINGVSQSQVIGAGQTFILAPNAKVNAISAIENLESIPPCLDLSQISELKCFITAMGIKVKGNSQSDYFEDSAQKIIGYKYNGIEYNFTNNYLATTSNGVFPLTFEAYDAPAILAELKLKVPGIISTSSRGFTFGDNSVNTFQIKTSEEIAKTLYLIIETDAPSGGGSGNNAPVIFVYLPFYEYGTKYPNANFPLDFTSLCPIKD